MTETRRQRGVTRGRAAGIVGLAGLVAAYARFRPSIAQVEGNSMLPTLEPGTRVLVVRLAPRRGAIVVAEHPSRRMEIVKRITAGPGDRVTFGPEQIELGPDEWWLEGDQDEWSTDSRNFGPLRRDAIRGRAFALRRKAVRASRRSASEPRQLP